MVSRRAASQVLNQVDRAIEANKQADRVLIPKYWFEEDGYGAAVAGILKSIELGLQTGSVGMGPEYDTLCEVRELLYKLDPAAKGR